MAASEKLPKELQEDVKVQKEVYEAEQDELKELDQRGLLSSDIIVLTGPTGDDYECVVEAAPVWLARGWKIKKESN